MNNYKRITIVIIFIVVFCSTVILIVACNNRDDVERTDIRASNTSQAAIKESNSTEGAITTNGAIENDYFQDARGTITKDRGIVIGLLDEIIQGSEDGSLEQNTALVQKTRITDYMNKENIIEIAIKEDLDCKVLVLMTDTSVNVTINKENVSKTDEAAICDQVIRITGRDPGQIVIQSIN